MQLLLAWSRLLLLANVAGKAGYGVDVFRMVINFVGAFIVAFQGMGPSFC